MTLNIFGIITKCTHKSFAERRYVPEHTEISVFFL